MMPNYVNALADSLCLDGMWELSLGGQTAAVSVPGCWEAQGFDRYAEGPALFTRVFRVPDAWADKRLALQFDAVSDHAEIAVDGQVIGQHQGLWAPFDVPLPDGLAAGVDHTLTVRVFKPGDTYPMRESLAGFLPDVCTTFGGMWQSVRLLVVDAPGFETVHVQSDAASGDVTVTARIAALSGTATASLDVLAANGAIVATTSQAVQANDEQLVSFSLRVPDVVWWQFEQPVRYTARLHLEQGGVTVAQVDRMFGFKLLTYEGEQLLFNGKPVFLRGLLHWGWYPDLICPTPDAETIRAEFRQARAMGFNMIKLCLWVPPPLYFEIADEEGMALWLELPMWLPNVTPALRARVPDEYAAILEYIHHHPSVIIYSLGCELNYTADADLLERLNTIAREHTVGSLLCDNSGSGEAYGGLSTDFADFSDYHFYCDLQYFDPLVDHFRRDWQAPRPWIFGEFCDSDDFRDPDEIKAAHGGELPWWWSHENPIHGELRKARRYQTERAAVTGWSNQALQQTSRQSSFVVRKTILEKVRRRRGMGGYVVTSFRDTPIATSAPYDDLGRAKCDPAAMRQFNSASVLVLDQGRVRAWKHGGDRPRRKDLFNHVAGQPVSLRLILSHSGAPLPAGHLRWWVTDATGQMLVEQIAPVEGPIASGAPQQVAPIEFQAPSASGATALTLYAELIAGAAEVTNQWPVWIYPAVTAWPVGLGVYDPSGMLGGLDDVLKAAISADPPHVLVASALPPNLGGYLREGGRVLLLQWGAGMLSGQACPFWRESIKLLEDHPVMQALPHAGFADLQFYSLATDWAFDAGALTQIDPGMAIRPVFSRLDARLFTYAHYIVEGRLGAGRVMASSLRLAGGLGDQPVSLRDNPAGRYLLHRMLTHLLSD